MDEHKIENCIAEGGTYPWFSKLSEEEGNKFYGRLREKASINMEQSGNDMIQHMEKHSTCIHSINAMDDNFNLSNLLDSQGIQSEEKVYIHFHYSGDMMQMKLKDLSRQFDDVWYPSADDVSIFDDTCTWLIFVPHYGVVSCAKP